MLKHRIFLVPLPERGLYWIGASSSHGFTDEAPEAATADYLRERLREVLRVPFTVGDPPGCRAPYGTGPPHDHWGPSYRVKYLHF